MLDFLEPLIAPYLSSGWEELLQRYHASPGVLRRAVKGMSREQLLARPVEGKWSTLEVVVHLADFDPILADCVKRTIAIDQPSLKGADESCFAKELYYHERDLEEELKIVELTRSQLHRILTCCPESVRHRSSHHDELGSLTVEQWVALSILHLDHHVTHVDAKRLALGLPSLYQ